ncbi:hypothetical protein Psi02_76100 [Planotetraspora silvatica]|uniref:Uncharacterized protein n=1 Tax=Planotetraspora silvatica TaxID=234614 RepID=A0A8J3XT50_9ACTN|nr:hypothetical protein [Planotetraspora silvatica]GII51186.1 hypothetical protein Psi02_76100 [Planotetraspora silvatica]
MPGPTGPVVRSRTPRRILARGAVPRLWVTGVDLPRAAERRRLAAVRAARRVFTSIRRRVDLSVVRDPELLLAVAGVRGRSTGGHATSPAGP